MRIQQSENTQVVSEMEDTDTAVAQLRYELDTLKKRIAGLEAFVVTLRQLEETLRESEAQYRTVFETTGTGMIVIEEDMTIAMANSEIEELTGYLKDEILGMKTWPDFIVREDRGAMMRYLESRRIMSDAAPKTHEFRLVDKHGIVKDMMIIVSVVAETSRYIASLTDISDRKHMEEQLRYLSSHDTLTGLYNRAYFEEEMKRLERSRLFPVSVIMVDVNGLKRTNDTLGHAAGDELLTRTAHVLRSVFRGEDVVARIGGDEFSVLLPGTTHLAAGYAVARVRDALADHNETARGIPLSFSIGYASAEKGEPLVAALNEADREMYREKLSRLAQDNA